MKMIKCYIRYEKLEAVREKLFALGVPGMSVSEVKGIGTALWYAGMAYYLSQSPPPSMHRPTPEKSNL